MITETERSHLLRADEKYVQNFGRKNIQIRGALGRDGHQYDDSVK